MKKYLEGLNDKQLEAATKLDGAYLVLAGAGSGKTKVLTSRIAYLIDAGIYPSNILAITFTNKAAREMKERVEAIVGKQTSFIGTFHSFGLKIIRENYELCSLGKNFTVLDSDDTLSVIKKLLKDKNLDPKKFSASIIRNKISTMKNDESVGDFYRKSNNPIDRIVYELFESYEKTLEDSNAVDFDDLLLKPVKLFKESKEALERYQDHYPYVLIDEYQDTNPVQYKLSRLLSKKYGNIFVVGDMNQSIYGFRQADYRNILNFQKDYKDSVVIKLEQNYRSTQTILKAANSVIKNNKKKLELNLWSEKNTDDKIKYLRGYDATHEVKLIIDEIDNLKSRYESYNSFAILYRTNAQSRIIEQTLLSYNMPYKVYGGFSYLNRKEIKDLVAYLKFVNNLDDEVSLRRIINTPKRKIGLAALNRLEADKIFEGGRMFDHLKTKSELEFKQIILDIIEFEKEHTLTELIDYTLERSGLKDEYSKEKNLENEIRLDNLMEFKSITASFEDRYGSEDLNDFLSELSLMTNQDERDDDNAITLMTLHSAKGLEFDVVFLVGMEEGLFPHSNSFNEEDGLDEERRLCYVGITRAKDLLYITNARRRMIYGQESVNPESRFIKEIDDDLLERNFHFKEEKQIDIEDAYSNTEEFRLGDVIVHDSLGSGVIIEIKDDLLSIAFKDGIKNISKYHKAIKKG